MRIFYSIVLVISGLHSELNECFSFSLKITRDILSEVTSTL